ncbi:MAG: putative DNA binding domain-containing protein, partial [Myxococcales bacterium]|nr:putative DNA binding domain-containing protein [Myxococcales bacterium]
MRELVKLPHETEWVEFKQNNDEHQQIGEYIAALANAAALAGKAKAYLLWGVRDEDHAIVGTRFVPRAARHGNEELESWLLRLLEPRIEFRFEEVEVDGRRVVLLEIDRAMRRPVSFSGVETIRVGSYKKKLKEYPEKERALWRIFDRVTFEEGIAREQLSDADVIEILDYPAIFRLLKTPLPEERSAILDALSRERLLVRCDAGGWNVTNLGAILFSRRLDEIPGLGRKTLRIIQYRGHGREQTIREQPFHEGYANGFEKAIHFLEGLIPTNEVIGPALRDSVPMFPPLAVRELVANALIHQDFSVTGAGPMVELFEDRLEITNPGEPLVETSRFLDS